MNSFIIFISHAWLRGWHRSEGYCDIAHPDSSSHEKYQLCVEGIGKLIQRNAPQLKEVYLWVDYGCINQSVYPEGCHQSLASIIGLSDCLFTPLVDSDPYWVYESTSFGPLVDYKASALQNGSEGYLNRSWCRLEMLLAAYLPLKNSLMRDCLADKMKLAVLDSRRPHFIYGSRESADEIEPIELFPLEDASFDKLNPLRGSLTRPGDEELIQELVMNQLLPLMAVPRPGYRGGRNALLQKHGRGRHTNEAGDTYDGEWCESRKQGKGRMQWGNGDEYVGQWAQNEMCGVGRMTCGSDGSSYEGEWRHGRRHGRGIGLFKDGSKYEGDWEANEIHGRGVYLYPDSSRYEGGFSKSVKEGIGTMLHPNGDRYEGDWSGGYMHGQGVFLHSNGGRYEGEWRYDKKSGYGVYSYPSGAIYEGNWDNDKKHGYGSLRDHRGGCYDGKWRSGKWKG